jgi:hypothetical protein
MMNPPLEGPTDAGSSLPDAWRDEVRAQLATGEMVLAWFEPDLDQRLCFARRLVILTDRRLLTYSEPETLSTIAAATNGSPASSDDAPKAPQWQTWPVSDEVTLRAQEHVGAGTLDLVTSERRLTHWKYTLRRPVQRRQKQVVRNLDEHLPKLRRRDQRRRRHLPFVQRSACAAGNRFALPLGRVCPAEAEIDPAGIFAHFGKHRHQLDPALSGNAALG